MTFTPRGLAAGLPLTPGLDPRLVRDTFTKG